MNIQKKVFIIVDGYSTGQFIAPAINSYGYKCIHVQSDDKVPASYKPTFVEKNYIKNLIWHNDDEKFRQEMSEHTIMGVIPGSEMGVLVADQIGDVLGLKNRNSMRLSEARRNKFLMGEALKSTGIPSMKQIKSNEIEEILSWIQKNTSYPIILKPIASGGTDGVCICKNETEVRNSFSAILEKEDAFSKKNSMVLAQEFLQGQEYVVNTVSYDGIHHITDMLKVDKKERYGSPAYNFNALFTPQKDPKSYKQLKIYTQAVLDALEIRYGAAHTEIMLTEEGPILIETGARVTGGIDPSAYTEAMGWNQVSVLIESYIHPAQFLKRANEPPSYHRQNLRVVFLVSEHTGNIVRAPDVQLITQLPSFHSITIKDVGYLETTTTFLNCPGYVNLVHVSEEQIARDYALIRSWEPQLFAQMTQDVLMDSPKEKNPA